MYEIRLIKRIAASLLLLLPGMVLAANTANQTVTMEVTAIDELSVSGNPGALIVNSATAGSEPTAATDSTTTYAITTNGGTDGKRITGAVDSNVPPNTTLTVDLTSPTGGSAAGATALSTTAADLVTGIDSVAESTLGISYNFSATVAAGVVASTNRTVTFTLTDT